MLTERDIFVAAFGRADPADRRGYLDQACGPDLALRRRVERLLGLADVTGEFLAAPAVGPAPADGTPAGSPTVTAPDPTAPQTPAAAEPVIAGRYELGEVLGEGGMGVVWRAVQTNPVRRQVALKLVRPGMGTAQMLSRFEAERQALALMDHPNIAKVLDGGATPDGRPFFVMELVNGQPIVKYCDRHGLTVPDRLTLFVLVCRAVQHAHQKGLIHRDLKPGNVLVETRDGRPVPRVIDFGVAKAAGRPLTDRTLVTGVGGVIGTPEYMSPEQAEGVADIDTRTDVYALGVILYELLTGSTPVDKDRIRQTPLWEVARVIRDHDPPAPSTRLSAAADLPAVAAGRGTTPGQLARAVRGELDWIVLKCLEKDRTRRYDSAADLARDLDRHLAHEPVLAGPPSPWYRLGKAVRRNRGAAAAGALVAAALLIGAVVSSILAVRATRAEGLAEERLGVAQTERDAAIRAEAERKRQLVGANLAQARSGRRTRRPGQSLDGVRVLAEAARLARDLGLDGEHLQDLRDEMVACLVLPDVRPVAEWAALPSGSADCVGFDADLGRYARSDLRGTIEVRQVDGDRLLARLPGAGPGGDRSGAGLLRFSPDGRLLAVGNYHRVPGQPTTFQVWDWRAGRVVLHPPLPVPNVEAAGFSPDGRRLAVALSDRTVAVYETAGWAEEVRLKAGIPAVRLAFHPDGTRLALADGSNARVQVWDAGTGQRLQELFAPQGDGADRGVMFAVGWHPAGDLLAAGCENGNLYLWDAGTGKHRGTLRGHDSGVIGAEFVGGGELLMSTAWDDSTRLWDPWTGRELIAFPGDTRHASRDGRRVASRHGTRVVVRELAAGRGSGVLPDRAGGERPGFGQWDVSPDGRWLAVAAGRMRFWDLSRGDEVSPQAGPNVRDLAYHRGGHLFTSGPDGVFRWEVAAGEGVVRVRPTRRLSGPGPVGRLSLDRDGRQLAVATGGGTLLLDPAAAPRKFDHPRANVPALSPDGRWVASGTFHGFGVRVFDAATGKLAREFVPDARISRVVFDPDGRWVVTSSGRTGFDVWEAGTWQPVRHFQPTQSGDLPGPVAFSADGRVMALALVPATVELVEAGTWRRLVRISEPSERRLKGLAFTPAGDRLVTVTETDTIRVWDLRQLRELLSPAGLDWDRPAYPPAPAVDTTPVRVEVDMAEYARLAGP